MHSRLRVSQRQLFLDDMRNVVQYHDRRRQQYRGEHGGFVYRFEKTVDSDRLIVIAEVKKSECWLVSGWKE